MSNEEVIELQELRKERDIQERKLQSLRYEIEDNDMAMRALDSWKKFRWVGFFICCTAFAVIFFFAYLHYLSLKESDPGAYKNTSDAVVSSISTVSIAFSILLLVILAIACIILGMRLFIELGESDAARLMAQSRMMKNYHIESEKLVDQRKILKRSLYEEELKMKFMLPRLEELEQREPAWKN